MPQARSCLQLQLWTLLFRSRQLCDEAKRIAIKRTGFTKAAAPTVDDVLQALGQQT